MWWADSLDFIFSILEIKNAAMKVKSDYHRKKRFKPRSLRRRCQDNSKFTPTKDKNGSSFNRSFYASIKQRKHFKNVLFKFMNLVY